MKKRMLSVLIALFVLFCVMPTCFAEGKTQDGLEVVLTTDKTEYKKDEAITATLTVTNNNDHSVSNVSLENVSIDGYEIVEGSQGTKVIERLQPKESVSLETTLKAKPLAADPEGKSETGQKGSEAVKTGIENHPEKVLIAAGLLLLCAALFYYSVKNNKGKRVFSILLGFVIVGSGMMMMSDSPLAAEALSKIEISTKITVEQKEVELKSVVSYRKSGSENEETKTIGDILPENFPTSGNVFEPPKEAWRTKNKRRRCFVVGEDLCFNTDDGEFDVYAPYELDGEVTENGGNYIYTTNTKLDTITITFYMAEGKLDRIEYIEEGYHSGWNGVYTAPPALPMGPTIGDILPDDFPTSKDNAWVTDNGNFSYIVNDNTIMFYYTYDFQDYGWGIPLNASITESGGNYIYEPYITFVMSGDKLEKIDVHNTGDLYNGVYTLPYEGPTIGSILPDDFPTSPDSSIPGNAWKTENGTLCYVADACLKFRDDGSASGYYLRNSVAKSEGNYIWESGDTRITFVMSGEKLIAIEYNSDGSAYNGIYTPPENKPVEPAPDTMHGIDFLPTSLELEVGETKTFTLKISSEGTSMPVELSFPDCVYTDFPTFIGLFWDQPVEVSITGVAPGTGEIRIQPDNPFFDLEVLPVTVTEAKGGENAKD